MTKQQLKIIARQIEYHNAKIMFKSFKYIGGGKLIDHPGYRNRKPKLYVAFTTPVDGLEKYYSNLTTMLIGPQGGIKNRKIDRMNRIPYNY